MKSKRILVVMLRPEGGKMIWGAEQSLLGLSKELSKRGFQITTLEQFPAFCRSRSVPFFSYELNLQGLRGTLALLVQALRVSRASNCDVVYAYSMYFKETLVPALFSSLVGRKPLIVSVNDDKGREIDKLSLSDLMRWSLTCGRSFSGGFGRMLYQLSRRIACRYALACFASTNYVANFARGTLRARRVYTIGRGLDNWWFEQIASVRTYDAVYVGRVDALKSVETLIRAWKEVTNDVKHAKLLIVGDGYEFAKIKELCKTLEIEDNVSFTGYVEDRTRIRSLLASSKMFLFASRKEGFARAVAEAMAAGLPCILPDTEELKRVYGEAAFFARLDDPHSYAKAVLLMLREDETRLSHIEKSVRLARTFTWENASNVIEKHL